MGSAVATGAKLSRVVAEGWLAARKWHRRGPETPVARLAKATTVCICQSARVTKVGHVPSCSDLVVCQGSSPASPLPSQGKEAPSLPTCLPGKADPQAALEWRGGQTTRRTSKQVHGQEGRQLAPLSLTASAWSSPFSRCLLLAMFANWHAMGLPHLPCNSLCYHWLWAPSISPRRDAGGRAQTWPSVQGSPTAAGGPQTGCNQC